jgi:hypothetical protein
LNEHILKLKSFFNLFKSRCKINNILYLSSFEKLLILYKETEEENYLYDYDKNIDLQDRLCYDKINKCVNNLQIFTPLYNIPIFYVYCQLYSVLEVILINSIPINNIIYIPITKSSSYLNDCSYYYLISIESDTQKRIWKNDQSLSYITRMFKEKYLFLAINIFRQFYKDNFGNNDYIFDFEDLLEKKNIIRWKQMKILYENIKIVNDDLLISEIMCKIIKINSTYYPNDMDIVPKIKSNCIEDNYKKTQIRKQQLLPVLEDETYEYIYDCFDNCRDWNKSRYKLEYYKRWKNFLTSK